MIARFKPLCASAMIALMLAGCAVEPLSDYRPVVDPARTSPANYETDLTACRAIALQVEADYKQRQKDQMGKNLIVGLLAGAAIGAVAGTNSRYQGDLMAYGAVTGMASGAANNDYSHDLVKYGPRRVIDRCMADRGHRILSDLGRA